MAAPLMPKATAVWLIDNTTLTFEQIAAFCGLHILEVQALADGEVDNILGVNPIAHGQLTVEEIERCQKDSQARMALSTRTEDLMPAKARKKYTPVSKRQDKPDAIAWALKQHPELTDAQIMRLLGTTKQTIQAIRERTHPNMAQIKARSPMSLGLCSAQDLDAELAVAVRRGAILGSASSEGSDEA